MSRFSTLQYASRVAGEFLKLRGYRWETRSWGELRLGIWRKTGKKGSKTTSKTPIRRLVIIPGFLDSPLSWTWVLSLISPVLRLKYDEWILVDFPGYGGFMHRSRPFHSFDLLTSAVGDLLDSLKPEMLIGHSLGGYFCAKYAAQCGEGIRPEHRKRFYHGPDTMILIDPVGLFADTKDRTHFEKIFKTATREGFKKLRPFIFEREPKWFRFFAKDINQSILKDEIQQFVESFHDGHQIQDELPKVKAKTWIIWGERDAVISSACAPIWLKAIGNQAQGIILKKIGHTPHMESPGTVAFLLSSFILGKKPLAGLGSWKQISN